MNSLNYFGTDTIDYGHYAFSFDSTGQSMHKQNWDEALSIDVYRFKSEPKGSVNFFKEKGFSALSITGSCTDTRGGTVSVFFMKDEEDKEQNWTKEQLIQKIKMTPAALKIVKQMPFPVEGFKDIQ